MLYLKSCPRCKGDLYIHTHPFDPTVEISCVQCGHYLRSNEKLTLLSGTPVQSIKPQPQHKVRSQ